MIKEKIQADSVITSPPYYGLRDYDIEPSIWDADLECEHDFELEIVNGEGYTSSKRWQHGESRDSNPNGWSTEISKHGFCSKCGGWEGALGLEPTFELYIKHLCDIYDLVWKVLKPTGTNWVNLGDTYSSGGRSGSKEYFEEGHKQFGKNDPKGKYQAPKKTEGFPQKCLLMIPQRFAIEMINRGWILRNCIVWHKSNAMPSSAKDRFTVNFEYLYFFVKSNKTQYWVNENTTQLVSKRPLGIKGIENVDWVWRKCNKCLGTGIKHSKCKACEGEGFVYNLLLQPQICEYCKGKGRIKKNEKCKRCKGKGIKKYNFWKGRQYFFEQQIEPYEEPLNRWGGPLNKSRTEKKTTYENMMCLGSTSKLVEGNIRPNPLGKNKRCVWSIPTKPTPEAHFAVFPDTLVKIPIKAGCPKYVCKICGNPREKIFEKQIYNTEGWGKAIKNHQKGIGQPISTIRNEKGRMGNTINELKGYTDCECFMGYDSKFDKKNILAENATKALFYERDKLKEIAKQQFPKSLSQQQKFYNQHKDDPYKITKSKQVVGFTDCNHGNKWTPGIVLDPFAGIGTTLLTAWKLGRNFIGFEISKEYCEIANKKLFECRNKRLDEFIYPTNKETDMEVSIEDT